MPASTAYADLELHFIAEAPHTYRVDVRFRFASSAVDAHLTAGAAPKVVIDQVALNEVCPDVDAYGQRLAGMLFADQGLKEAFAKARDQAEGAHQPLRFCLRLDLNDAALHTIRWETLHDPAGSGRLFTSERVILSRYIDSPDTSPIDLRTARQLKTLVVVAAPTNLEKFRLALIDVDGEVNRARTALNPLPVMVLTRDETQTPVTLAAIGQALREGVDLLYLVAHGQMLDGTPLICLENQDGTAIWVDSGQFVQQIAQLARRPLLIVLASCQSAGQGQDNGALAALGPRLAGHGVAAVIAMQGNVGMSMVAQFVPVLLRKLRYTGQVDRALAAARAAVLDQPDWWMPVLFLRVRSGQILEQPYVPEQHLPGPFRGAVVRMVEDYEVIFGGRAHELAVLDSWLEQDTRPYAFLHAPAGRGKTALLIHWVARVQQRGDWTVIFVPVSLRYQTATAESVLGALATSLADFYGEREQIKTYNTSPDQLRPLIADYVRRPCEDGRRLLVVLDGLDETVGWHIGREIFPREPGTHIRIVASARQRAQMSRADWYEQLGWRAGQTTDLELAGLRREAVSDILRRIGDPLVWLATDVDLLSEIARVSEGDPLTIRFLVEALQDGTLEPGKLVSLPPGLEAYVRSWYKELEQKSSRTAAVSTLLSLCAIALGPLSNDDIQRLAFEQLGQRDVLNQAVEEVGRFIIGDGSAQSGYIFSHPRLREIFLEKVRSPAERRMICERFIADGQRLYDERVRPLPAYVRQFWITHLAEADAWELIRQVLTEVIELAGYAEQPWAAARFAAEGSYTGYLADLDRLWEHADQCGDIVTGIQCALILASIRSLSGNLTPKLLAGLVTVGTPEGRWSMAAALEHVRQMPDSKRQVEAIQALIATEVPIYVVQALDVICAINQGWERAEALGLLAPLLPDGLLPIALEIALLINDEKSLSRALEKLAPHLPGKLLSRSLNVAYTITDAESQFSALIQLASYLPPAEQLAVYYTALEAARAIADEGRRARALSKLASRLPMEEQSAIYQAALETAHAIDHEWHRSSAYSGLVSYAPDTLLPSILDAIPTITDEWTRTWAIIEISSGLPVNLLGRVFEAIRNIMDDYSRGWVLTILVRYLPVDLLPIALEIAHGIVDDESRAEALGQLAPFLPLTEQPDVYEAALKAAYATTNEWNRDTISQFARHSPSAKQVMIYRDFLKMILEPPVMATNNAWLLGELAPDLRDDLLSYTLEEVYKIVDEGGRAQALALLAPYLPTELLPRALEIAHTIVDKRSRVEAFEWLAPNLPLAEQPAVYHAALEAARHIGDEPNQAAVLVQIAPHLPFAEQLPVYYAALQVAKRILYSRNRISIFGHLASNLPSAEQLVVYDEALKDALTITDGEHRAKLLTELISYLPLLTDQPSTDQLTLCHTALEGIRTIADEVRRATILSQLISYLPNELLPIALESAYTIKDERKRAELLTHIAAYMTPEKQQTIFSGVLRIVQTIEFTHHRTALLGQIVPYLPVNFIPSALETAYAIVDERDRVEALGRLIPYLNSEEQPVVCQAALDVAYGISDEWSRAYALSHIAPYLSSKVQLAVCQDALRAAYNISDEGSRVEVFVQIIPYIPLERRFTICNDALDATRAIVDEESRVQSLGLLAPCLPGELFTSALEIALSITDSMHRVGAIGSLASYLPNELLPRALATTYSINPERSLIALGQISSHLAAHRVPIQFWIATLHEFAPYGRIDLLSSLAALTPWLVTLTTEEERTRIAQAIIAVCRCWA